MNIYNFKWKCFWRESMLKDQTYKNLCTVYPFFTRNMLFFASIFLWIGMELHNVIPWYIYFFFNSHNVDCSQNHCVHGACNNNLNGYTCICQPGYTGTACNTRMYLSPLLYLLCLRSKSCSCFYITCNDKCTKSFKIGSFSAFKKYETVLVSYHTNSTDFQFCPSPLTWPELIFTFVLAFQCYSDTSSLSIL